MKNTKNETIKFSVLIPVYNVEDYLSECLDSVLNQTYSDFEVIITNDGSTDNSVDICMEYAAKDSRINVYHQENKGLLMARRNSILNSTGEYCLFLDSDDYWESSTLEIIHDVIKKTEADIVMFNYYRVQNDYTEAKQLFSNSELRSGITRNKVIEKFITTNELNSLCFKAVRTSIIDLTNDYSDLEGLVMGEDALQSIPLFIEAKKIIHTSETLYNYRINEESSTNSFNPKHLRDINVVNEAKVHFLHQVKRTDLLNPLSKRYINTIARKIMDISVLDVPQSTKVEYLEYIHRSECFKFMNQHLELQELTLPVKMILNNFNEKKYASVIKRGKFFNFLWNNLDGLRENVRTKALT